MATSNWVGTYDYKGFSIMSPSDEYWIVTPYWDNVKTSENFRGSMEFEEFSTIAKAKKWIRDVGVKLKEEDYA